MESSVNFLHDPQSPPDLDLATSPTSSLATLLHAHYSSGLLEQTTLLPTSVFSHMFSLSGYSCADSLYHRLLIIQASMSPSHAGPFQFRVLHYLGCCHCSFNFSNPMRKELGEGQAVSWKYSWCHKSNMHLVPPHSHF